MAARMAREGRLDPESFINPSLPLYLQWPVLRAQWWAAEAGWLRGRAADALFAGRILSALAGAAAVVAAGAAAGRVRPSLAMPTALLLAVAPGVVNLSHFATPEPWLLIGTALTLLCALDHVHGHGGAAAMGTALGLTAGTKYTAAALALPCALALWWRPRQADTGRRDALLLAAAGAVALLAGLLLLGPPGRTLAGALRLDDARLLPASEAHAFVRSLAAALLAAGAGLAVLAEAARSRRSWAGRLASRDVLALSVAALLAFLATTPYALVRPLAFLSDLAFNQQTRHQYKGLADASTSFGPYLGLLADALTGPVAVAALLGLLVALVRSARGDGAAAVVAAAAAGPYLLVASSGHQALRFLAPAWPAAAILAALALRTLPPPRTRTPLLVLVTARAAVGAILVVRLFFVDARYQAARWIESRLPAGETVDLVANHPGYGPALPPERIRILRTLSREMAPAERFAEAAEEHRRESTRWLVLTAAYYERFLDHPEQAPERAAFFRDLLEGRGGFEVAARFRQEGWRRPAAEFLDPEIVVLRRTGGAIPPGQLPTR